ncbi:hypothetical protein MBLNU459_g5519t2 [Dothideomycetes sp. NU459]
MSNVDRWLADTCGGESQTGSVDEMSRVDVADNPLKRRRSTLDVDGDDGGDDGGDDDDDDDDDEYIPPDAYFECVALDNALNGDGSRKDDTATSASQAVVDVDATARLPSFHRHRLSHVGFNDDDASLDMPASTASSYPIVPRSSERSPSSASHSQTERAWLGTFPGPITVLSHREGFVRPDHPLKFKQLIDDVTDFSLGFGVVPEALRVQSLERAFSFDHVFYAPDSARASLGSSPIMSDLARIVDKVRELRNEGESEASWNCFVHGPIGMLVESLSRHTKGVRFKNIVDARVRPVSPSPDIEEVQPIRSKMVDFAIVLQPSDELRHAFIHVRRRNDDKVRSFNHTYYDPVLDKPIVVSMVTESEWGGLVGSYNRLAVWAAAHLSRLEELIGDKDCSYTLPFLPCLLARDSRYYLLYADGPVHGATRLWASIDIGDVSTYFGLLKIISVLQLLMAWAELSYRPWFESLVDKP